MPEALKIDNISMKYQAENGETNALDNVSFNILEGDFVSIVGPSGCGKSTLLSIISGLEKPTSGKITLREGNSSIGYMFQNDCLFEFRTIYKNIILGLEIKHDLTTKALEYAEKLMKEYCLYEFKDKYPSQLSGGMRQRCALIRTLSTDPGILLLDEPFSALDYQTRLAVSNDVLSIIKKENKTAIMVTHDIGEAVTMSDRVVVLSKRPGRVKKIIDIDSFDSTLSPVERRETTEYLKLFNEIWSELDVRI